MKKTIHLIFALSLFQVFNLQAQMQLWGTTQGTATTFGTIYTISNGDSLSIVHEFLNLTEGGTPTGKLCLANNGFIYGTTVNGGLYGEGIIYKINPNTYAFTKIHDFISSTGVNCFEGLSISDDGILYGTTFEGGAAGGGVLFKFDPATETYSVLFNFNTSTGNVGSIWELINNKFYGTTTYNGANSLGTIFSFDLGTNIFTVLHNNDSLTGYKYGSLLHVGGGLLIGTADCFYYNTPNPIYGLLYSYDINTNVRTVLHNFDTLNGFGATPKLVLATDGKIYGIMSAGGPSYPNNIFGDGVLFSYELSSNTYTALYNFYNSTTGSNNQCGLMQASNGLLYSATFGNSKVFSFDIGANALTLIDNFSNFNTSRASSPILEIGTITSINNKENSHTISVSPNPAEDYIIINNIDKASIVSSIDILGREIDQIQLAGFGKTKVEVSNYPHVFFVKDNQGQVIKVMKSY